MRTASVAPMLARREPQLPDADGYAFEPKWDGFRCLVYATNDDVDLRSRNDRPFARYFPEVVAAIRQLAVDDVILDGELLIREPRREFANLMARLHPAESRVARLAAEMPAELVIFDVVIDEPFAVRRQRIEGLVGAGDAAVRITPMTTDRSVAETWLRRPPERGIDGVIAKRLTSHYEPGKRSMIKVKPDRTADCVVAGFRVQVGEPLVASLLLGLYDEDARLRHVGVVTAFTRVQRAALVEELAQHVVPLDQHPWRDGFALEGGPMGRLAGAAARWTPDMALDWLPLRPHLVAEVSYDEIDGTRFRHPARFRHWRPDRDAASCSIGQLGP